MKEKEVAFIGRVEEQALLRDLYKKSSAELVSITGRRRVGKTRLVKSVFKGEIDFYLTGTQSKSSSHQLGNFAFELGRRNGKRLEQITPKNWQRAFHELIYYLESIGQDKKLVVFLDELPWLATHRSGFLDAFSFFWNSWAEDRNILVIICGSAASWMINKVVRNKGGLHNRITQRIQLQPFTLAETSDYLQAKGFNYDAYTFTELYMVMGGIPHYLKELQFGQSNAQNIDRICFNPAGLLHDEFDRLYASLFNNADQHIAIVTTLAGHHNGLTRTQIVKKAKVPDGGKTKRLLEELEFSGFIKSFYAFGKRQKGKIYRLIDGYSLFYLRFIERSRQQGTGSWFAINSSSAYETWRGYAFENVGLQHIPQIKKGIGIAAVSTNVSSFYQKGSGDIPGIQIDLVIDRADRAINLVEFKFYNNTIKLSPAQLQRLQQRARDFQRVTGTKSQVFNTIISPFGISEASNRGGVVAVSLTVDVLFER